MKFQFKHHDFILKNLDDKYVFLFSKKTKKEFVLSPSFLNLLNSISCDTSLLGLDAQNEINLINLIRNYSEIFDTDTISTNAESSILGSNNASDNINLNILYPHFMHSPKPWGLMIETTTNCNLRCKHCYNSNSHENIDISLISKALNLINPNDNLSVTLTGGEVFCHPQIKEIVDLLAQKNKVINFLTNAIAINTEVINWLMHYKDFINIFQISLYSTHSGTHDEITNTVGSFEKTLSAILNLKKAGFKVVIATLVVPQNISDIRPLIELSREHNIPINFCFKCISNCDNPSLNEDCDLSIADFKSAYASYLSCIKNFHHVEETLCGNHVCTAGYNKCVLGVKGELFLCPTWKRDDFVNIQAIDNFDDFWFGEKVSHIRNVVRENFPECGNCQAQKYCHPCMADNYNKNSDIFKINTAHCELMREKYILDMERIRENNC